MTEEDAKARVAADVPRETLAILNRLAILIIDENARQNLVAPSTIPTIWARHILDSAQLAWLAKDHGGPWLDIGSGAGLPGLVVAAIRPDPITLAEPRAKRATFLRDAASELGMSDRVTVIAGNVQSAILEQPARIISARAVARLPSLFDMAQRHADARTLWLLPKGRTAAEEVAEARREWQGDMRLEPSLSQADSAIVVARGVRRKS